MKKKSSTELTKLIYVASPYTSKKNFTDLRILEQLNRFDKVTEVIGKLQDIYEFAFIGPITQSHCTAKYMVSNSTAFDAWEKRDLTYISRSDEMWVVMIEGWSESTGVKKEIEFCKSQGIPVKFLDPETLKFNVRMEHQNV